MKNLFPATENDISDFIGRTIKSPILISDLKTMGLPQEAILDFFSPLFKTLNWDPYDARRLRIEYLIEQLPTEKAAIQAIFKDYYTGQKDDKALVPFIEQLTKTQTVAYHKIQPWRRRSIAQFLLSPIKDKVKIVREPIQAFAQAVDDSDFRSWPRTFHEAPAAHVEHPYFSQLMTMIYQQVKKVHPIAFALRMTAHFMSVKATRTTPGNNSPEGAHEDGVDFIISALVVNRINLKGGKSQVIENHLPDGPKEMIYERILQPGEFFFQADTGDELTYGTDLWHHVTPFYIADEKAGEGWRDIIGFDVEVVSLA